MGNRTDLAILLCMAFALLSMYGIILMRTQTSSLQQVVQNLESQDPNVFDFNGATAYSAELPEEFRNPSALDLYGIEIKGSFTARSTGGYGVKYITIIGTLSHTIQCELRGYRILTGMYAGLLHYCLKILFEVI